ncbi:hypothetical protein [Ferrovibrio xuzhouensis]|uniref:Uncharacterized protein n=1 Tax=Ferrovibrio xuzhouensis TaxID=1576914 RepID=A0ABV7VCL1_9PROT
MARFHADRPDPETVKRDGWQETGILAVHPDDARLDFVEREVIRRIGNRLYGARVDMPGSNIRSLRR